MRGSLIRTALRLGHEVIGQIRRDTALFALPTPRERERAAVQGCTATSSTRLPPPRCRPRSTASPAMADGRPGCATPCAARAS